MAMAEPFDNWKFELSLVLPAQHSTAHTKMLSHDMGADSQSIATRCNEARCRDRIYYGSRVSQSGYLRYLTTLCRGTRVVLCIPAVLLQPTLADGVAFSVSMPRRKTPKERLASAVKMRLAPPRRGRKPTEDVEVRILNDKQRAALAVRSRLDLLKLAPPSELARTVQGGRVCQSPDAILQSTRRIERHTTRISITCAAASV
jgi:hypothetical protein